MAKIITMCPVICTQYSSSTRTAQTNTIQISVGLHLATEVKVQGQYPEKG